ncbi:hypothetical protein [Synechococcus sp. CBW1107]|uniref:hypothetical protein n=1 Tax=Synechococcus sp. CBW1107 TaxID=2789857 RepID=UPI002AD2AC51|nr:hypothetical protein [Synechococcus sp. CBW1107]CAK6696901.1 hypothetical protein MNNICLKF_02134 [Synechococcus sp. CBW1107]
MPSPEEQTYSAVERAYGQGDFARALELALALQPELPAGRLDLLDQRLQLLIGHIYLYGLAKPREAEAAYQAVLKHCSTPHYRQLAEQSLRLCRQADPAERPTPQPKPESPPPAEAEAISASTTPSDLPATPWLTQLQEPQQALAQIQAPWATAEPAANPTPIHETKDRSPEPEPTAETTPPPPVPAMATDPQDQPLSESESSELERGLLLVRLSNRTESANRTQQGPDQAIAPENPGSAALITTDQSAEPTPSVHVSAPSLGAAWTLFKRNWRTYLILEGLVLLAAVAGALLQRIGNGLQGLAELNPLAALLPAIALAIGAIALNLWSNLLGVSLQMLPALAFHSGSHPSARAMLQLLRRDFWRYVRAGVVVGLATAIGLVLLIVPGVLVAIATPVVIRRVTCHQQAAMAALIASVKEVGNSPAGAGLLKWELVAGLLVLGSVLLCGVPLLITIPLGGILVQHYLAYSGMGSTQD